jgi:Pyruvate/2-oxoacid:ferredoxin oxidoreductase gamma subunit
MIFTQHPQSAFAMRARTARSVLMLGRKGAGVGLLGDLIATASLEAGVTTQGEETHDLAALRTLSAAAVWLGTDEPPAATNRFDLIVAFDRAALYTAYQLAGATGRVLLPLDLEPNDSAERFRVALTRRPVFSPRETALALAMPRSIVTMSYLAGRLSNCLELPLAAWKAAIDSHVRPRERRAARVMFAAGRRFTRP